MAMPPATSTALDPFDRIHALGKRETVTGGALGIVFACSSHVVGVVCALTLLPGAHALAATVSEIDIEVVAPAVTVPPPPPEPVAAPPPEPIPPPPAPKPEKEDPYEEDDLPPPPAEA